MKTYEIHDNGGRPFVVHVYPGFIEIYRQKYIGDYPITYEVPDKKVLETSYQQIWIGDNDLEDPYFPKKGNYPGNSILVQIHNTSYIYIGSSIYSFSIEDSIQNYYSPVGNSDVPYPYAIGQNRTYFMLDKKSLPNEMLDKTKDGYEQFYGYRMDAEKKRIMEEVKLGFPTRTIAKRV